MPELSSLFMVVPKGEASRISRDIHKYSHANVLILLAKGSINSGFLNTLGINEVSKEMLIITDTEEVIENITNNLDNKRQISSNNHGIIFQIDSYNRYITKRKEDKNMKVAIFTVIERGKAQDVVESSKKAGAKGGTILHGRGSAGEKAKFLLGMEIEPEKEIVMTIVDEAIMDDVIKNIREASDVDNSGKGILFVLPVSKSIGIL